MDSGYLKKVEVRINGSAEEPVNGKNVLFYQISCSNGSQDWTVKKRFSDFDKLAEELKKTHRNLPPMPGKTMFALKNKDDIERRRKGLEDFLKVVSERDDCYSKQEFIDFLNVASTYLDKRPRASRPSESDATSG